jgi:hypothetical protein
MPAASLLFLCLLTANGAFAQLVGTKDLTEPPSIFQTFSRADLAEKEEKFCFPSGGIADGFDVQNTPAKLTLTIPRAEAGIFDGVPGIKMTLRLKNDGIESTYIPWVNQRVESIMLSEDGQSQTFGYDVATIDFFVGRPFNKDPSLALQGEAVLWSQPGNASQLIKLNPGEWIVLQFKVKAVCTQGDSTTCLSRLNQRNMRISAWWYLRKLTTTMHNDCILENGAYTQNEVNSKPVKVIPAVLQESQPTQVAQPAEPKPN